MKHGGPYTTGDCVRSIKAIANAEGRVLYIAPDENEKRPCRSGTAARPSAEQNVHLKNNTRREKSQCRR